MKIVIAGGTGFLGRPLAVRLASDGHRVVVLGRHRPAALGSGLRFVDWSADERPGTWTTEVDGADAVVNLAGESVAGKRWSAAQKTRILDSRIHATRALVDAIGRAPTPPAVFVSSSAVGYYGPLDDEIVSEDHLPGADFLAGVCVKWEAEAMRAASGRTRVTSIRTGLVLERDGGALRQMLPPFWLGAGGPVGSGRQYWPWIHRADWIELVRFALVTPAATGPMNLTAPEPVASREFARALGRALHRPAVIPMPAVALRLIVGEMADSILTGQRAVPAKAQRLGYAFKYARLNDALAAIF